MKLDKMKVSQSEDVLMIMEDAKKFLYEQQIDQWQDGYPNKDVILNDIAKEQGFVYEEEDTVLAYLALLFDGEKTYDDIHEGKWLSQVPYATIHRIMIKQLHRGSTVSTQLMQAIKAYCKEQDITSIRVDTHEDNHRMQKYLAKHGFQYCGVIYLEDQSKRYAYECLL